MAVPRQGISRQLFKTQSHKKADISKVNGKFPNCFQPVQLFLSVPSCLPSFVSVGLRGERGEARVVNNLCQQSHLCIEYCNQFSEKPPCCQMKPTEMASVVKMSSSLNKTYLTIPKIL